MHHSSNKNTLTKPSYETQPELESYGHNTAGAPNTIWAYIIPKYAPQIYDTIFKRIYSLFSRKVPSLIKIAKVTAGLN